MSTRDSPIFRRQLGANKLCVTTINTSILVYCSQTFGVLVAFWNIQHGLQHLRFHRQIMAYMDSRSDRHSRYYLSLIPFLQQHTSGLLEAEFDEKHNGALLHQDITFTCVFIALQAWRIRERRTQRRDEVMKSQYLIPPGVIWRGDTPSFFSSFCESQVVYRCSRIWRRTPSILGCKPLVHE